MLYEYSLQTWIDELYKQLTKVNSISNKFKKLVLNKRIFSLITYLKDNRKKLGETVNTICLVGKDIFYYKLKKDEIEMLKKYNIRSDLRYQDDYYHIDELIDILSILDTVKRVIFLLILTCFKFSPTTIISYILLYL